MTHSYPTTGAVRLHTLLAEKNASTRSLTSGAVKSDLVIFDFDAPELIHHGFKPMVREGKFDWGELAIVTFLQAKFYGKPLVLLPAVIGGRFQHNCVAYNSAFGTLRPADLNGKRIGVRSYTQTTGVWIRGILQNEYGVDPASVHWITFEDAHLGEYKEPANVVVAPKGMKLKDMLFAGEVDAAMIGSDMPKDDRIKTVIPDPKKDALAWHARTGVIPMNHMVVVREELSRRRPDVVREIYRMLLESRDLDTQPVDGLQMRPFGVEALRPSLEMIIDYAFQQKVIGRRLSVDELFDDTTRKLGV
ncbi:MULTISPECIES: ABC transporter substrate-binding protein [unclassified Sinorhizobium]|uniref:ABC transporter substrate-binding protein n=1 Tax=unclassified Sinorhizobium TaxID=2613772 RepID=UPI003526223D